MGDWTTCPECRGSGFEDPFHEEPCHRCKGVREIFVLLEVSNGDAFRNG